MHRSSKISRGEAYNKISFAVN
ncbi:unnamed protein product [Victoria cruziana]